jgi:hypothetical protein
MTDPTANGPIFIGGPDRSGKTLLAAILGSHSEIAIPIVGSNLWPFFYGRFGDLARDRNFERCLAALLRYKHARFLQPDPERLRAEFRRGEPTYARLFGLIHAHFAERQGKPRWGDQTGLLERYADGVLDAYPGSRMIQMLRDPRDRYEASLRMWPAGKARAGGAVARWRSSVAAGERNLRRHPDRYRLLRYEDLVADPEAVVSEACDFVGVQFEPAMLAIPGAPAYRQKLLDGDGTPDRLINAANVGAYRGVIPAGELAFIQGRLRGPMRRHGYPLDRVRMGAAARVQYALAHWPLGMLRMAAWSSLETLQHRYPRLIGRRPVGRMVVAA